MRREVKSAWIYLFGNRSTYVRDLVEFTLVCGHVEHRDMPGDMAPRDYPRRLKCWRCTNRGILE